MRSVSSTIRRLAAAKARQPFRGGSASGRLTELTGFGPNSGRLKAWHYLPQTVKPDAPLVVVLHGCTQNAADFDSGTGWSQLADEYGFAVLLPEQTRANNFNLCFNWYEPNNSRRDAGEPLSITQMVDTMASKFGIDRARVFITGLSAGGAMTSVMLATYPEIFSGGAIVAGLPFGSATNIPEAFDRMRGHGGPSAATQAASIRSASPHRTSWPSVAVWHGTNDTIVDVSNGSAIIEQWRQVHGISANPDHVGKVDGYPHRAWHHASGKVLLEEYLITGMGHGTPLSTSGEDACGVRGPYMLEVAISSTRHIAASWGLTEGPRVLRAVVPPARSHANDQTIGSAPVGGVGQVIEDALRAAGLMR